MFTPSLYEVMQAEKYFLEEYRKKCNAVAMSHELAVRLSAVNVWKHARQYQLEETEKKKQEEEKALNEIMNIQGIECYEKDGTAYLKLEAVARGLGFVDKSKGIEYVRWNTVKQYLREIGFSQEVAKEDFIPENIFYRLAMKAKNETAERFQAFVADEVIPSIRRHGMYATADTVERMLADPDVAIRLLNEIKSEREKRTALEQKVEKDKPKVLFADAVAASHTSILVGELAKILKQNGVNMGQNRLFAELRERGYLIRRKGSDWNMPTQRSMEMKLFEIKETVISHADGHTSINKTVKVTGAGQKFFINLFLKDKKEKAV